MKSKILLLLLILLFTPYIGSAYYVCHPCCSRFQLPGWWFSADYLLLWRKKRFYPPLVTTNPTNQPLLSDPTTRILFGDEEVGGAPRSGVRFDLGFWMSGCLGFGGGFMGLKKEEVDFEIRGNSGGDPIIGIPFFNTNTGMQDVQLISFPPGLIINGSVDIKTGNHLWGYDLYARYRFLASCCFKFDLIAGYLFSRIDDDLDMESSRTIPLGPIVIKVEDHFNTTNDFYAGLVGIMAEWRSCNWAITFAGKVGFGNMVKKTHIHGLTRTTVGGMTTETAAGIFAQPSNSGEHSINKFEVVPSISTKLQLRLIDHLWVTAGYTYMFWPAVALAGEQVNVNINPNQIDPVIGTPAPIFEERLRSFWAHGFTAGIHICY